MNSNLHFERTQRTVWPRAVGVAVLLVTLTAPVLEATASQARGSRLALSLMGETPSPELVLAQRTIDRDWGPHEGQVAVDVPGWRSEGLAMMLSAGVPGTGQVYAGGRGGWWFAVVEAVGWATNLFFQREARALRAEARGLAGAPGNPASPWSFDRWERSSGQNSSELEALYLNDREVFLDRISNDPSLDGGWDAGAAATRAAFLDARKRSNDRLRISRVASAGLWTNHVLAAFDALRQARRQNAPIERDLELRFRSRWDEDGPVLTAALERRF